MNMPPPHGPGGTHPGHPGMGASASPSPGMMNRSHPHGQFIPQHPQQQHYMDSPTPSSNRGRKRKLTAQHPHPQHPHQQQQSARRPSMHGQPHGHPQQHPGQHGFPGRPMPPFLGLNLPPTIADELPESIFDDLDRLTPRDIAVARYAKNHELLSMVFDARRIDTLTPAPSPYADVSADDLKAKAQRIQAEMEELELEHAEKLKQLRESGGVKRGAAAKNGAEEDKNAPKWGENASRGRILGVGFVRAETPEALRSKATEVAGGEDVQMKEAEGAEEKEAERRQAEKEAIEKINLELGVTQPSVEVAAPAPVPVRAAAAATESTVVPTAPTTDAATTTEQSTEIEPPVSAAELPAAPVLAHVEAPADATVAESVAAVEPLPAETSASEETTAVDANPTEPTGSTDTAAAVEAVASQPGTLTDVSMLDQPSAPPAQEPVQATAETAEVPVPEVLEAVQQASPAQAVSAADMDA